MHHYCTYFDQHYLTRGLALYESLRCHGQQFTLWVLCLDVQTEVLLKRLELPQVRPVPRQEFERNDTALAAARIGRSRTEYYFTCTPSWLCYLFDHYAEIDLVTYVDADLFFFTSPEPLFKELGAASIQLIEHRFPPRLQHLAVYGRFNVGWISVRRDASGLGFTRWWRERCLEWCYNRLESGRYADQGYLTEVEARFAHVNIACHPGANLALWNIEGVTLTRLGNRVMVDGQALLFYHFHNLRQVELGWYDMGTDLYDLEPLPIMRQQIYAPYLIALADAGCVLTERARLSKLPVRWPSAKRLARQLCFHYSLLIIGRRVMYLDVTKFSGLATKVWRLFKLATRWVQHG